MARQWAGGGRWRRRGVAVEVRGEGGVPTAITATTAVNARFRDTAPIVAGLADCLLNGCPVTPAGRPPRTARVVIELTVCAVWSRLFLTIVPSLLVAAATRRATAGGVSPGLGEHTLGPPAWSAADR